MSDKKRLTVLCEKAGEYYGVHSPAVGIYSLGPEHGDFRIQGSMIGKLKILNTTYDLHLPGDVYGRVIQDAKTDLIRRVEYGEELFRLNRDNSLVEKDGDNRDDYDSEEDAVKEGGHVIVAFTTGIFYSKPAPDAPPFVKEGQEIEKGKALGLIEVMKTFNHIIFHGTENSNTGMIKKILVKDSEEVKSGQALFIIE